MSIIASNVTQSDLEDLFSRHGELQSTVKLCPGTWQITFKDSRDAKDAELSLDGYKINGLRIRLSSAQGLLFLSRVNPETTSEDLDAIFGRYGHVTELTQMAPEHWRIKYGDIRDAEDAQRDMHGREFDGQRILIGGPHVFDPAPEGHVELTIAGTLRLFTGQTVELVPTKVTIPIQ